MSGRDDAPRWPDDRAERRRALVARLALTVALGLYGAVALTVLLVGPELLAGRIGPDGSPERLDPAGGFVLVLTVTVIGFVALFAAIPRLVLRAPMAIVNVPHRERWDSPSGRRMLARLLATDMLLIAAATVLLCAALLVISALGGYSVELPGWLFLVVLLPYLAIVLAIAIGAYVGRRYVPPADPAG